MKTVSTVVDTLTGSVLHGNQSEFVIPIRSVFSSVQKLYQRLKAPPKGGVVRFVEQESRGRGPAVADTS